MNLIKSILDFLYPPRCVFCHKVLLQSENGVCVRCRTSVPRTQEGGRQRISFLRWSTAPFYYESSVRESLLRFKFGGVYTNAQFYAPFMAEAIRQQGTIKFDAVTWVPISKKRLKQRGYDQAEVLAKSLAVLLGLGKPVCLLEKVIDNKAQSGAGSRESRRNNVSGCWRICSDVTGKNILLVDDIITTGATLSECARILGLAGAENVYGAAVARNRMDI